MVEVMEMALVAAKVVVILRPWLAGSGVVVVGLRVDVALRTWLAQKGLLLLKFLVRLAMLGHCNHTHIGITSTM